MANAHATVPGAATLTGRVRLLVIGRVVHGYTWRLLRELDRHGVEVRAVHRDAPASMEAQFAHESGPEGNVPALNSDRASLREAVRFMRADAADAIVALGGSGNLPLLLAACALKRRGTPVYLFTDANVPALGTSARDWARHVLYRALRPAITEAWTLGRSNEGALAAFGVRRRRRLPLYAVDYSALACAAPARATAREGERIRLLCIARLVPEKNLLALCQALQGDGVADRFELALVGEGPERSAIEREARSSRMPIRLLGSVPRARMGQVFADADALVLPSAWEPWGIAVVEALGLGLPVVATARVGAAVSLAEHGGVVVSPGTDARSLGQALATLARELEPLRSAARAAAAHVRDEFDTEAVARRIAEVLREVPR